MDVNIPEEIQEKLKIIEKEADFSEKMPRPKKFFLIFGLFLVISSVLMFFLNGRIYTIPASNCLLGFIYISGYFSYKKLYDLHSNARDIINFYRNREGTN